MNCSIFRGISAVTIRNIFVGTLKFQAFKECVCHPIEYVFIGSSRSMVGPSLCSKKPPPCAHP